MRYADLHLHTYHSDGTRSPTEVIDLAVKLDLQIIAISDHDNVAAFHEIRDYAAERAVLLIPAAELSANHSGVDVHILAYAFDPDDERLATRLAELRSARARRGETMVDRLRALGYPITLDRVKELCGDGALGRPHVARALVEQKVVSSVSEAFDRFLKPGKPGYVGKESFEVSELLKLVHASGGLTSVAHPTLYPRQQTIVREVLESGVDAIEVYHPDVDSGSRTTYQRIAREMGKFVTGGSDDHGTVKKAETIGSIRVPENLIEPILARVSDRRAG